MNNLTDKIYIIDSSTLLSKDFNIRDYSNDLIVIPLTVIEELDNINKSNNSVKQYLSRNILRIIESLLLIENSNILIEQIDYTKYSLDISLNLSKNDNIILYHSLYYTKEYSTKEVILLTEDLNLRIKAKLCNINSVSDSKINPKKHVKEHEIQKLSLTKEEIDELYKNKSIEYHSEILTNNQPLIVHSSDEQNSALSVFKNNVLNIVKNYDKRSFKTKNVFHTNTEVRWAYPKSKEQKFAMHYLFDQSIPLVTMAGRAGVGKTLIAISAALYQVLAEEKYKKIIVTRSLQPMGREIGFLSGDKSEKLRPWMMPIQDNFEYIVGGKHEFDDLIAEGIIEMEAPTFMRGRSFRDTFIIVDEAQNMTSHEVKTILTRIGENTKVVFLGDVEQIDDHRLNDENNGLSQLIQKMQGEELFAHITLKKGERSQIATLASEIL